MNRCPFCNALNSTAPISTPDGNKFILVSVPSNGNFNIPPNGLIVDAFGCNKCGALILGSKELIGMNITN